VTDARQQDLANPDGVDLAPPHSLTMRFANSLQAP